MSNYKYIIHQPEDKILIIPGRLGSNPVRMFNAKKDDYGNEKYEATILFDQNNERYKGAAGEVLAVWKSLFFPLINAETNDDLTDAQKARIPVRSGKAILEAIRKKAKQNGEYDEENFITEGDLLDTLQTHMSMKVKEHKVNKNLGIENKMVVRDIDGKDLTVTTLGKSIKAGDYGDFLVRYYTMEAKGDKQALVVFQLVGFQKTEDGEPIKMGKVQTGAELANKFFKAKKAVAASADEADTLTEDDLSSLID